MFRQISWFKKKLIPLIPQIHYLFSSSNCCYFVILSKKDRNIINMLEILLILLLLPVCSKNSMLKVCSKNSKRLTESKIWAAEGKTVARNYSGCKKLFLPENTIPSLSLSLSKLLQFTLFLSIPYLAINQSIFFYNYSQEQIKKCINNEKM